MFNYNIWFRIINLLKDVMELFMKIINANLKKILFNETKVNTFKKLYDQKQIVDKYDLIFHSFNCLNDQWAANKV